MAHIHITMTGGQTYPIYLGIMAMQPDGIILVHSASTVEEAERVRRETSVPTQMLELDPVNYGDIYLTVQKLCASLSEDDRYTINISGGTKLWTIAFYEHLRSIKNVEIFYIDQNNLIYNLTTLAKPYRAQITLETETVFRLNGTKAKEYIPFSAYTAEDENELSTIKELRNTNINAFNAFSLINKESWADEFKKKPVGLWRLEGSSIKWNKISNTINVTIQDARNIPHRIRLKSPHCFEMFFHTGWFEYEVALKLAKWEYAKEIWMNVKFPYESQRNPKNEIDIIVNTGDRLLFVECKTQIANITDIDKFRTAVKNYGGMACKSLFVTYYAMKETAKEKCKDSDVIPFSIKDVEDNTFFSVNEALHQKLNLSLKLINKK